MYFRDFELCFPIWFPCFWVLHFIDFNSNGFTWFPGFTRWLVIMSMITPTICHNVMRGGWVGRSWCQPPYFRYHALPAVLCMQSVFVMCYAMYACGVCGYHAVLRCAQSLCVCILCVWRDNMLCDCLFVRMMYVYVRHMYLTWYMYLHESVCVGLLGTCWCTHPLNDWLHDWITYWIAHWINGWPDECAERAYFLLTAWLTDCQTDSLTHSSTLSLMLF